MKVVCIDTDFGMAGIREQLEWGKVYEASFVFYDEDSKGCMKAVAGIERYLDPEAPIRTKPTPEYKEADELLINPEIRWSSY